MALHRIWSLRGKIFISLGLKDKATNYLEKAFSVNHEDSNTIELLMKLNADTSKMRQCYFDTLIENNEFDKLDQFFRKYQNEENLLEIYTRKLSWNSSTSSSFHLNKLFDYFPDNKVILKNYLNNLIDKKSFKELDRLIELKPNNKDIIISYTNLLIKDKK
ncbi:hypothetical protein [Candidatus Venteria ishoeyi]|uniref:Tetratricopeptide repeat protein n=1 Tax=Candidatus Venteria ishoeyi TaxID=1899563 RepID=A0A1H6FBL4_9GAMM|nr:hypothetical protein [Candidatus Venteria ishoeyi]SEH06395.1 Uncharacterised protein [Candidatus Venteria ishoeyi]